MFLLSSATVIEDNHIIDVGARNEGYKTHFIHIVHKLLCIKHTFID